MSVDVWTIGPALVVATVMDAIEQATPLRALFDSPRDGKTAPNTEIHRRFRIDPPTWRVSGRGGPGGELAFMHDLRIVLLHDVHQEARRASFEEANRDWIELLRVVCTSAAIAELCEAVPGQGTIRVVKDKIEIEQRFSLSYDVTLPEAS